MPQGALLRGTDVPVAVEPWLPDEIQGLDGAVDPANLVLQSVAVRVKDGVREGMVGSSTRSRWSPRSAR